MTANGVVSKPVPTATIDEIRKVIAKERSRKKAKTLSYIVKISMLTVLSGALSFMGAFVFRDFFLALFRTSLENLGMSQILTNFFYLLLVLAIAVPALAFVMLAKANVEVDRQNQK